MPKVVDAARVTTPANTVWRNCSACDQLTALGDGVELCAICGPAATIEVIRQYARNGWKFALRYAALIGRIEAWAVLMPDVSDTERLDHIREALATLRPNGRDGQVK